MGVKVLGCGNILASDEGAGIHAVRKLDRYSLPKEIVLLEVGRPGTSLLEYIIEADILYIVDAISREDRPGSIHRYESGHHGPEELFNMSIHGFNLVEAYRKLLKQFPDKQPHKIILLGIEIKERGKFKTELSAPVKKGVNRLVRELRKELLSLCSRDELKI